MVFYSLSFFPSPGGKRNVQISPSQPIYYGYTFPGQAESSSVIVHVQSDSDICMTFSIQNTTVSMNSYNFWNCINVSLYFLFQCPVFDLERNIQFSGYWQTVNQQGGITVPVNIFLVKIYIFFFNILFIIDDGIKRA